MVSSAASKIKVPHEFLIPVRTAAVGILHAVEMFLRSTESALLIDQNVTLGIWFAWHTPHPMNMTEAETHDETLCREFLQHLWRDADGEITPILK